MAYDARQCARLNFGRYIDERRSATRSSSQAKLPVRKVLDLPVVQVDDVRVPVPMVAIVGRVTADDFTAQIIVPTGPFVDADSADITVLGNARVLRLLRVGHDLNAGERGKV